MRPASSAGATWCATPGRSVRAASPTAPPPMCRSNSRCAASACCSIGAVRKRRSCGGVRDEPKMSTIQKQNNAPARGNKGSPPSKGVHIVAVGADEAGMRLDRFLEARFPGLSFSHIQRIIRKGELRVNGKRAQPKQRLEAGQAVRLPPLRSEPRPPAPGGGAGAETRDFLNSITLHEDADVLVLDKPMGLA